MGRRNMFHVLMVVGVIWAAAWFLWLRDEPSSHSGIGREELDYILANRQQYMKTVSLVEDCYHFALAANPS